MGTGWRVLCALPRRIETARLRSAIERRLDALVGELSHWLPDSALSRFNRAPAGRWVSVPGDLARVVDAGLRFAALTEGAVDPAIGRLVDLWGYGPPGPMPRPDAAAIAEALAASGWRRLAWDAAGRRLRQPGGLSLDLSAIGKGHAIDMLADLLQSMGVHHCLVEIGGELVGRGVRPDGQPWWVELEAPSGCDAPPLRIALHGLAVATSGTYRRGDHSIDPSIGRPAANGIRSVSVIAPTALEADAWATALTVTAPPERTRLIAAHDIAARVLAEQQGSLFEEITPALQVMLAE